MIRAPVGIGKAHFSGEDMYMSGMRGKCLNMLHIYEDNLWALGDKSIKIPFIPSAVPVAIETPEKQENEPEVNEAEIEEESTTEKLSELKAEDDVEKKEVEEAQAQEDEVNDDDNQKEDTEIDHEQLLIDSFLTAAKFKSKDFKLPIIVSTFMKVMQTCW